VSNDVWRAGTAEASGGEAFAEILAKVVAEAFAEIPAGFFADPLTCRAAAAAGVVGRDRETADQAIAVPSPANQATPTNDHGHGVPGTRPHGPDVSAPHPAAAEHPGNPLGRRPNAAAASAALAKSPMRMARNASGRERTG